MNPLYKVAMQKQCFLYSGSQNQRRHFEILKITNIESDVRYIDSNPERFVEEFFEYRKDDKVYAVIRNDVTTPPLLIFENVGSNKYKPTDNTLSLTIPESWYAVGRAKKDSSPAFKKSSAVGLSDKEYVVIKNRNSDKNNTKVLIPTNEQNIWEYKQFTVK